MPEGSDRLIGLTAEPLRLHLSGEAGVLTLDPQQHPPSLQATEDRMRRRTREDIRARHIGDADAGDLQLDRLDRTHPLRLQLGGHVRLLLADALGRRQVAGAVGPDGGIAVSEDSGASWKRLDLPVPTGALDPSIEFLRLFRTPTTTYLIWVWRYRRELDNGSQRTGQSNIGMASWHEHTITMIDLPEWDERNFIDDILCDLHDGHPVLLVRGRHLFLVNIATDPQIHLLCPHMPKQARLASDGDKLLIAWTDKRDAHPVGWPGPWMRPISAHSAAFSRLFLSDGSISGELRLSPTSHAVPDLVTTANDTALYCAWRQIPVDSKDPTTTGPSSGSLHVTKWHLDIAAHQPETTPPAIDR